MKSFNKSLILHLAPFVLLLILSFLHGGGSTFGNSKQGKGNTKEEEHIIPKADSSTEMEIIEGESESKKKKGIKHDCEGLKWFGGVGITVGYSSSRNLYYVAEIFSGYPAMEAGLKVGDILLNDGELRGEPGTPVDVKYERDGQIFDVTLTRDKICTDK